MTNWLYVTERRTHDLVLFTHSPGTVHPDGER